MDYKHEHDERQIPTNLLNESRFVHEDYLTPISTISRSSRTVG